MTYKALLGMVAVGIWMGASPVLAQGSQDDDFGYGTSSGGSNEAKTGTTAKITDNPMDRSFGLGYDVDLEGITARYMFSRSFGLDLTLGFGLETGRSDGEDTKFDFDMAIKAVLPIITVDRLRLNVTPGLFMQYVGVHDEDADGAFNLSLFGGLAPEIFIWDGLAVEVMFGLAFNLQNLNEPNDQDFYLNAGTIGSGVSIISGLLFHYYF